MRNWTPPFSPSQKQTELVRPHLPLHEYLFEHRAPLFGGNRAGPKRPLAGAARRRPGSAYPLARLFFDSTPPRVELDLGQSPRRTPRFSLYGMQTRFELNAAEPNAYPALRAFERHILESGLSAHHRHLIKLYASQLNGCSYCVASHAKEALHDGFAPEKLIQLGSFRETPAFDETERVILQLTYEVTHISQRVSDATYTRAIDLLGEAYTAKVLMGIIAINMWNRVGVTLNMVPPK